MIASILLVPSAEHREALLGEGVCGARVPVMWDYRPEVGVWAAALSDEPRRSPHVKCALVLAYGGSVVREGRDRAAYVLACRELGFAPDAVAWRWSDLHTRWSLDFGASRRYYGGASGRPAHESIYLDGVTLPALSGHPDDERSVDCNMRALATICAARNLGRVVLLDESGKEVQP